MEPEIGKGGHRVAVRNSKQICANPQHYTFKFTYEELSLENILLQLGPQENMSHFMH